MDDQGKLSIEGVNQIIEQNLADDPIILERARAYTEACKSGKCEYNAAETK